MGYYRIDIGLATSHTLAMGAALLRRCLTIDALQLVGLAKLYHARQPDGWLWWGPLGLTFTAADIE
jgi:hypothetical protein